MSLTITLKLASVCEGGCHTTATATVSGDVERTYEIQCDVDQLLEPSSYDEIQTAVLVWARLLAAQAAARSAEQVKRAFNERAINVAVVDYVVEDRR